MGMRPGLNKISAIGAIALISMLMLSGATAVTTNDVSVDIQSPETDDVETFGGILTEGVSYEYELSNTYDNNTEVDTYVVLKNDTGAVVASEWQNDTTVDAGESVTVDGELTDLDSATYDKDAENDVTITTEATFTDQSTSDTITVSDSVDFKIKYQELMMLFISAFVVVAVIGVLLDN